MFKNVMSKIAWVIVLLVACIYIFTSIGTILTELMETYAIANVLICVIFAASVAKVFMDAIEKLDAGHRGNEGN